MCSSALAGPSFYIHLCTYSSKSGYAFANVISTLFSGTPGNFTSRNASVIAWHDLFLILSIIHHSVPHIPFSGMSAESTGMDTWSGNRPNHAGHSLGRASASAYLLEQFLQVCIP